MIRGFSAVFLLVSQLLNEPKSIKDLTSVVKDLYADLSTASIYKEYSETVRFSFVNPGSWNAPVVEPGFDLEDDDTMFRNVAARFGDEKPLALYIPGLDCAGISGTPQFDEISSKFELWRLSVTPGDRSSLGELSNHVANFINDISTATERKVILIGESFGGLLAPIVALKVKSKAERESFENPLMGMVLVNPATSFDETLWDVIGPTLATLRFLEPNGASQRGATPYTVLGGLALSLLIPDRTQLQQITSLITNMQPQSLLDQNSNLEAINSAFGSLGTRLPGDVVEHRLKNWLIVGSALIKNRLHTLDLPTLVVAGDGDNVLPSKQTAEHLSSTVPNCETLIVRGSGHFVLDDRVNLTEAIIFSNIDPMRRREKIKYDPIRDWSLPDEDEIRTAIENRVEPLRRVTSPVFFSTDEDGKRWRGIGQVPSDGPIVFVANHQLFGLDVGIIVAELIEKRGIPTRGLAHPIIFPNTTFNDPDRPNTPGLANTFASGPFSPDLYRKFGAVSVSPRSYFRLLQSGQNVLLFPGGVREVFHGKDEAYKLFWPEKVDFVRMAARFNATVVPLSSVGSADSVRILVDAPDLVKLPFIGERVKEASASVQAARWDVSDNEDELFTPPFAVPAIPARHYFVFGKPFSTRELDSKDHEGCSAMYDAVKAELERGFDDLLRAREHDPYRDFIQRMAVERATGKVAPTFETDLVNLNHQGR